MKTISGSVRWGIIGAGDVCEKKSGPAFNKVPDSELVAIMRRNPAKAKDFATRHLVPKFYTDANDLINDPEINAIYIATPPAFHEEYTIAALEAGKSVYVEKPVAINSNSCRKMIEAEKRYNIPVSVAHYRRRLPLFKKVKDIIDSGMLGKILFATIHTFQTPDANLIADSEENWRINPAISGGGLFHDLAPHQLDLMYWYFGRPIQMNGVSANHGGKYNAPELTHLDVTFEKNIHLIGAWSFSVHESIEQESCEIIGDKGKIAFSFFRNPVLEIFIDKRLDKLEFPIPEHIQQPMIEQVVRFFRGEGSNPCSLDDALESLKMMDATLEE
jgi:1,5-anhydro-D-fructose reductase (1,5-anhydro-D-mannitol-forming)